MQARYSVSHLMAARRKSLLISSIIIVVGSLFWSGGYAMRLRSDSFRREVEGDLSRFFELPCDVGFIRGRTFSSREFHNVSIWLPDRRDRVFHCGRAVWEEVDPGASQSNELEIADGVLVLGTDRWRGDDYKQVLHSGLSHDFEKLRLRRLRMERFEIAFNRGGLMLRCRETSGGIDLSDSQQGIATLTAYDLNGCRVSQGVRIHARFIPGAEIRVNEMALRLPSVPLAAISDGMPALGTLKSGRFSGDLEYSGNRAVPEVVVRGDIEGAQLADLTDSLPTGPLEGRLSVKLIGARVAGGVLRELFGRGTVDDFSLEPFAPLLGRKTLSGKAAIRIDGIEIVENRLNLLKLSSTLSELNVEEWLWAFGKGSATGRLTVRVNNLDASDRRINSADIELRLLPPPGKQGTIDRSLLLSAAEKALRFSWPSQLPQEILPERVSYVECGVRLLIRDNELRILGTHGKNADTILTISVFGRPFGIVKEQSGAIDLTPWIERMLHQAELLSPDRVRELLQTGLPGE